MSIEYEYIYIYCVVHKTYRPYLLGTFFFSRYPNVALAHN